MLHISDLDEWLWSMEWSANAVSLSLELFLDILCQCLKQASHP